MAFLSQGGGLVELDRFYQTVCTLFLTQPPQPSSPPSACNLGNSHSCPAVGTDRMHSQPHHRVTLSCWWEGLCCCCGDKSQAAFPGRKEEVMDWTGAWSGPQHVCTCTHTRTRAHTHHMYLQTHGQKHTSDTLQICDTTEEGEVGHLPHSPQAALAPQMSPSLHLPVDLIHIECSCL